MMEKIVRGAEEYTMINVKKSSNYLEEYLRIVIAGLAAVSLFRDVTVHMLGNEIRTSLLLQNQSIKSFQDS